MILGIGNPGMKYAKTRHNIGFAVVDHIVSFMNLHFQPSTLRGWISQAKIEKVEFLLIKPDTYVNLSGQCAQAVLSQYQLPPSSLLVVVDDMALPTGTLRMRKKGTSGGHNGLESIIASLGTIEFPRLRIGIGNCENPDKAQYVLAPFTLEEEKLMSEVIPKAGEAALAWVKEFAPVPSSTPILPAVQEDKPSFGLD